MSSVPPPPPPAAPSPESSPAMPPKRFLFVLAAGGAVLLSITAACCCGGVLLLRGGNSELVGVWTGTMHSFEKLATEVHFKSSGRFEFTIGTDQKHSDVTRGRWRVRDTEGDTLMIEAIYDTHPDDAVGWTATKRDDGGILLTDEFGNRFLLKRKGT